MRLAENPQKKVRQPAEYKKKIRLGGLDGVMPGAKGQRGPLPLGKRKSLGPTSADP